MLENCKEDIRLYNIILYVPQINTNGLYLVKDTQVCTYVEYRNICACLYYTL